jgi:hypothetical protein
LTLDEAFTELGMLSDEVPVDAMACVLDGWEAAGPRCRALLHEYVAGDDLSEATERALFPILHLLGEQADTAAFADICALAGDAERADLILGEAAIDTLPCILIGCYGGDPAPLQRLIARADADPVVREGALMAMAYLTQTKRITRAAMQAYLVTLFDSFPAEAGFIGWVGWVRAVAMLGFTALSARVMTVFERRLIAPDMMPLEDFRAELRHALEDPGALDGFFDIGIGPLGSAIATLTGDEHDQGPPPELPIVNPLRDIGRNDPCPCGSGKKFKKCCLGQAA